MLSDNLREERVHSRIYVAVLNLVLFGMLSFVYSYYVTYSVESMGFIPDFNIEKYIFSIFCISLLSLLIRQDNTVRSFFNNVMVTVYVIPALIVYSMSNQPNVVISVSIISVLVVIILSKIGLELFDIGFLYSKNILFYSSVVVLAFMIILIVGRDYSNFNFDLRRVYEVRETIRDSSSTFMAYASSIMSKIIIPMVFVLGIAYKRPIYAMFALACAMILFGYENHKGIFIYPFIAGGSYVILSKFNGFKYIIYALMLMVLFSIFDTYMFYSYGNESIWGWFVDIAVRRALMLPPLLDFHHIMFFSENDTYLWSNSRITFGLIEPPYELSPPNQIGLVYFDNPSLAANTGFIGNGYAQAGMAGALIYSVGLGLVIALLNSYGKRLGMPLVASLLAVQMMTAFTGADFLTMLLSHGLAISILLLAVIQTQNKQAVQPLKGI